MAWAKLQVPRIRFERFGVDATLDWTTVKAVKFVFTCVAGSTGQAKFDDLFVTAGADGQALTGVFRARYKYIFNDESITDESLPSPVSDKVGLTAEALNFVIPQASAIAMDPQTTEVWPYIWSASMGAYYRTINPIGMNRAKKSLNEWGAFLADGTISADDRIRILTIGRCVGRRYIPGTDPIYIVTTPGNSSPVDTTNTSTAASVDSTFGDAPTSGPTVGVGACSWDFNLTQNSQVLFNFTPLVGTPSSITSIILNATLRDPGGQPACTYSFVIKISGVTYTASAQSFDGSDLLGHNVTRTFTTSPATGVAWTAAERNGAAFGILAYDLLSDSFEMTAMTLTNNYVLPGGVSSTAVAKNVLTFNIQTSETELLLYNKQLDTGRETVPDDILGIVGSHFDRTLCLTPEFLYFSDPGRPGIYPALQAIKLSDGVNEENLWIHKGAGAVYVGTTKDIYRLEGDLTAFPNGTLNALLRALNIGSPPVCPAIAYEGNALCYLASDGPRMLMGEVSTSLQGDLSLLLRGIERYGVLPISTAGRHRLAMADGYLYWAIPPAYEVNRRVSVSEFLPDPDGTLTPSDKRRILTVGRGVASTSTIIRYTFDTGKWSYRPYSKVFSSLARTIEGTVVGGTSSGDVITLDTGTEDDGQPIFIELQTAQMDDKKPNSRKVPFDLALRMDTGGDIVDIAIHLDGSDTAADTFQASTSGQQVYVRSIADLDPFRRIQLRISGQVSAFKLWDWNISYRDMPQHHYHVDTGNVTTGKEYVRWFREITLLARTDFDLEVDVYFDDVLATTEPLVAVAGVNHTYRIPLVRGVKGKQPRVVIRTTADASAGEDGFELYWVQWKMMKSGNETQNPVYKWSMVTK